MLIELIVSIVIGVTIPKLYMLLFLRKHQRTMMYYMFWGFFSAIVVYSVYEILGGFMDVSYREVTVAPLLEEFVKAFPLIAMFIVTGRRFEKHVLPYALASGIGFSILGNYLATVNGNLTQVHQIAYVLLQAGGTSLMQGCCTALIGYGIFLLRDVEQKALPALLLGLYSVAVLLHSLYNLLVYNSETGKYFGILISFCLLVALLLLYYQDRLPRLRDLGSELLAD